MLQLTTDHDAVRIPVKVIPGASRTRYLGELNGRAKIAVSAPPEKGKANQALIDHLARILGVRKRDVAVVSGHTSHQKTVQIEHIDVDAVRSALKNAK